jgi:anti-sigma regulatory factor (Ser/Thr protein kinase)
VEPGPAARVPSSDMPASIPMAASRGSALPIESPAAERRCLRFSIAGGPRAPGHARAWLHTAAVGLPEQLERKLEMLISELVNNSVVHGQASERDVIEIEVRSTPHGVRAQVSDSGAAFAPRARTKGIEEPGGWGLVLVERVAQRWGVERAERTLVWFELAA